MHAFVLIFRTRIPAEASGVGRFCRRRPGGRLFCLVMERVVRVDGPYGPLFSAYTMWL